MTDRSEFDAWSAGQSYEHYMGRWSRKVAAEFLRWLGAPEQADWIEIGCGSGALTEAILAQGAPRSILATDRSPEFVAHSRATISDSRVRFGVADAQALPTGDATVDVVTSALVLNFIPDPVGALREMRRVLRPQGLLSFYVWDYPGGGIGFIDAFWKAATRLDAGAAELDEGKRFPFCTKAGLHALCQRAGLDDPAVEGLDVITEFPDFEAFWHPFSLGAGPAPGYCQSLPEARREQLKQSLAESFAGSGPIRLPARAWAVQARLN